MATFVLVAGFHLGGWAWRGVAGPLREAGHTVYPLSLTGLAERVHLASPQVDLETHVADILNLLEYEELREVILVGHSYGGLPVRAAADRASSRIGRVVYVDSGRFPTASPTSTASRPPPASRPNVRSLSRAMAGASRRRRGIRRPIRSTWLAWSRTISRCCAGSACPSRSAPPASRCGCGGRPTRPPP